MKWRYRMKKRHFITKTIWQIFLYAFEVIFVSLFFTWISTLLCKCYSLWDYIERFLICYTMYQLLVIIILNNINDIAKDSCLAYITNLKKALLYADSNNKNIKKDIIKNINYQLDNGTINNNEYRRAYELLKKYIENTKSVEKSYIECELINAEHRYELISLNWRYSFFFRLFK